jgi:hypothetical protein
MYKNMYTSMENWQVGKEKELGKMQTFALEN